MSDQNDMGDAVKSFNKQAFGPWEGTSQRIITRTNASSGSLRKRFQGTNPPPPTISQTRSVITGGFEFAINAVNSASVSGYNVYSSITNNPAVAKLIRFMPQPKIDYPYQSIKFQDTTAVSPFYWAASVNGAGKESVRVPIAGTAAPIPTTSVGGIGGSSGAGAGGGRGGGTPTGRSSR